MNERDPGDSSGAARAIALKVDGAAAGEHPGTPGPVHLWSVGNVAVIDVMAAGEPSDVVQGAFSAAAEQVLQTFDPPLCAISVDEVNSDLLGEIVRFRTRGCALALYGATPRVQRLFTLTWLERIMKLTPTLQDAIAFLQDEGRAPLAATAGRAGLAVQLPALEENCDI